MVVGKGLLLKGLGVCALCAGGTALFIKRENIKSAFSSSKYREKIVRGALECEDEDGSICSLNGEIFIKKKAGSSFKLTGLGEGTGKIKVYKVGEEEYKDGFKFLIEDNDINGTGDNNKLEEFETYEIRKGTEADGTDLKDQYFLSQKTDVKEGIKKALGLSWDLPESSSDHERITNDNLKDIKFKGGAASLSGESVTLTISKEANKEDFPLGYRFTFKNTVDTAASLTIGEKAITLKKNSPVDFKIKKNEFSLSLEKAWNLESLSRKVGLECQEATEKGGNCSLKEGGEIFVKRGSDPHFKLSSLGEGKIKVYEVKESEGYNENLKFSIEDKDIAGPTTNKLEELETYEIKVGGSTDAEELRGKYYLSRKTDVKTAIKNALGLPWDLPDNTSTPTNITSDNLKNIKFKGGAASMTGGTVTLTISKEATKTEFPLGYKFTFKNTAEAAATLRIGSETISIKKDSPIDFDFRIKREGLSLSLEKAWSLKTLAKKVGLVKKGDFWDVGAQGLNVKQNSTQYANKIRKTGGYDGKGNVKVYEGQDGYNEGFKFSLEDGDVTLNNGGSSVITLGQFQSYEIVKGNDDKWYLSKKEDEEAKIKELLGFKNSNCQFPADTTPKECTLTTENIKTIKFDGAGDKPATVTGTPKLTIGKATGRTDFPLGYKFTFSSDVSSTITIPTSTPYIIRDGLVIDYKIKKSGENNQTLTLERAWNPNSFMVNVIYFEKGSKDNEWVAKNVTVNIKQETNKTTGAKADTNKNNAKIRVYEGFPGYKHGMKFMVEDGDTTFTGGGDIKKLTKYETYEIFEDTSNNKWYLSRKQKAEESIRELLGLPKTCKMPTDSETPTCDLDSAKLNEIKFKDKGTGSVTITGGSSVKLKITKENSDSYPLGYKFTFMEGGFTIPQGSSSLTVQNNSNAEFKIKETGNTLTLEKA